MNGVKKLWCQCKLQIIFLNRNVIIESFWQVGPKNPGMKSNDVIYHCFYCAKIFRDSEGLRLHSTNCAKKFDPSGLLFVGARLGFVSCDSLLL